MKKRISVIYWIGWFKKPYRSYPGSGAPKKLDVTQLFDAPETCIQKNPWIWSFWYKTTAECLQVSKLLKKPRKTRYFCNQTQLLLPEPITKKGQVLVSVLDFWMSSFGDCQFSGLGFKKFGFEYPLLICSHRKSKF